MGHREGTRSEQDRHQVAHQDHEEDRFQRQPHQEEHLAPRVARTCARPWYKEVNPNWKDDNKDTVAERQFKDLLKKKQSTWTPGKPGRPPAWAAEYVQKQKEEKKEEK